MTSAQACRGATGSASRGRLADPDWAGLRLQRGAGGERPCAGQVWHDYRAGDSKLALQSPSFAAWYEQQLHSRLKILEQRIEHLRAPSDSAPPPSREQLLALAHDLPVVWNHPQTQMDLKQRLCRLLVHKIVCDVDAERSEVILVLHWHGGRHSELRVPKLRGGAHQHETSKEAAEIIRTQAGQVPEEQIAVQLSELGLRTGTGRPWTAARVRVYLQDHRLETYRVHQSKEAGMTLTEAAKRLDLSTDSVRNLI